MARKLSDENLKALTGTLEGIATAGGAIWDLGVSTEEAAIGFEALAQALKNPLKRVTPPVPETEEEGLDIMRELRQ